VSSTHGLSIDRASFQRARSSPRLGVRKRARRMPGGPRPAVRHVVFGDGPIVSAEAETVGVREAYESRTAVFDSQRRGGLSSA